MNRLKRITVLVIDDSATSRRAICQLLEGAPDIEVVDRAADGEEGLKKAEALKPDLITLDLEMPRLDGFTFLRLLKARSKSEVIVLSSYAHRADVFKALELGAYDFVAKPAGTAKSSWELVRHELLEKVRAVRLIHRESWRWAKGQPFVVAVAASTGGPAAVQSLLTALAGTPVCVLVAQHMPKDFTRAFADRLNQTVGLSVSEARNADRIEPGRVLIAPGGQHLELRKSVRGLSVVTLEPVKADKHAPSADRLFGSVAAALGRKAMAVVLTGMGNDGALGASVVAAAGGEVWAEAQQTAVIGGMPQAAVDTGAVKRVLPLPTLAAELAALVRRRMV